jgi:prepilin-type N-terminal cleavage/methylation domain-containing protein
MPKSKQIKKRSNQKGFTLAEMLVTLIIIGVLAGVMIVAVPQIVNRSRTQVDKANAKQVTSAVTLYEADQGAADCHGGDQYECCVRRSRSAFDYQQIPQEGSR